MTGIVLKQLKILNAIIVFHSVLVVNNLRTGQVTPKVLLHHKAMLKNVARVLAGIWMIRAVNLNVTVLVHDPAAFPFWMSFAASWPCPLTLYPVLFANLVDQLRGHSWI
jgi:hypothetical protein